MAGSLFATDPDLPKGQKIVTSNQPSTVMPTGPVEKTVIRPESVEHPKSPGQMKKTVIVESKLNTPRAREIPDSLVFNQKLNSKSPSQQLEEATTPIKGSDLKTSMAITSQPQLNSQVLASSLVNLSPRLALQHLRKSEGLSPQPIVPAERQTPVPHKPEAFEHLEQSGLGKSRYELLQDQMKQKYSK